jgi:hypothetical protein
MLRHIKIEVADDTNNSFDKIMRALAKQWQLAGIWMRDANMHSRPRRALIEETTSRDIAGKFLDDYFDMVEQILRYHEQSASCAGRQRGTR